MSHRNSVFGVCALFASLLLANSVPAVAQYYDGSDLDPASFFHSGATNPSDEGWDIDDTGGTSRADASDQQYPDISAWQISATGRRLSYFRENTLQPGDSWTLITRFRVVNNNTPLSSSTVVGVEYGSVSGSEAQRYIFSAGSDSNGQTLLRFQSTNLDPLNAGGNGESHIVAAGPDGHTDYVTVALVHDGTGMDVYVNDVEIFEGLASISGASHNRVGFGDGQTVGGTVMDFVDSGDGSHAGWSYSGMAACNTEARLYCLRLE